MHLSPPELAAIKAANPLDALIEAGPAWAERACDSPTEAGR